MDRQRLGKRSHYKRYLSEASPSIPRETRRRRGKLFVATPGQDIAAARFAVCT